MAEKDSLLSPRTLSGAKTVYLGAEKVLEMVLTVLQTKGRLFLIQFFIHFLKKLFGVFFSEGKGIDRRIFISSVG